MPSPQEDPTAPISTLVPTAEVTPTLESLDFGNRLEAKLNASDATADDVFGASVALSGDTALIGSPFDNDSGGDSGSAYVFVHNGPTWSQQAKLTADDATESENFGISVAVSGNIALVAAPLDDDACIDDRHCESGSAYIFVRSGNTWSQEAKLTAGNPLQGDGFGHSVAVNGDTALIGAYRSVWPNSQDDGSAYVFTRSGSTWSQQAKLTPVAPESSGFGWSVALSYLGHPLGNLFSGGANL